MTLSENSLIVNADDFGINESVNMGIVKGFLEGIITSVSLLPNGEKFEQAVALAEKHQIPCGIHIGLVLESPVYNSSEVSSLTHERGCLPGGYISFFHQYLMGRISRSELKKEIKAQIERVLESGINVTHLDSHQHIHMIPGVFSLVRQFCEDYDINCMRIPDEVSYPGKKVWSSIPIVALKSLSKLAKWRLSNKALVTNDFFSGVVHQTKPSRESIKQFLSNLPSGIMEWGIHVARKNPEDNYRFQQNRDFVGTLNLVISDYIKNLIDEYEIDLTDWASLKET